MLQFTLEPFKEDFEGEWLKNIVAVKSLLYDFYAHEGVRIDTTSSSVKNVRGLDFNFYESRLSNSKDSLIMTQQYYSTLLGGYDFSVCVSYNNPKDKQRLERMWLNSMFD